MTAGHIRRLAFGRPGGLRRGSVARLLRRVRALLAAGDVPDHAPQAPPSAERPGVAVIPVQAVPEGGVTEAMFEGVPVAVCRVGDEAFVVENTCPHAGGPLGEGAMEGFHVVCPLHGWPFDVRTGRCTLDPGVAIRRWRAWVRDGVILADPAPLPPAT